LYFEDCIMFKTPLYFEHKILKMNDIFKLETSKFVIVLPRFNTNRTQKSIKFQGAKI